MARTPGRGGRPSKGDRHVVVTRVPVAVAEQLFDLADEEGTSVSQIVSDLVVEHLPARIARAAHKPRQEALAIDTKSA